MFRRRQMKQILGLYTIFIAVMVFMSGCSQGTIESKSMEQIYKEEGIPVRVQKLDRQAFKTTLTYHATLSGIEESIAGAPVDEKVEQILVKVGDKVRKDQILFSFPEDSPSTKYYQVKTAFENAKRSYERIDNLYKAGGVSLQERDNIKASYERIRADWDAIRQTVKVKSPISGYVTSIFVSETDNVKKKSPLALISKTEKLKAVVWVTEEEITTIKKGIDATASWMDRLIRDRVIEIDLAMHPQRKAFRVIVEFDNHDLKMNPGITATISLVNYKNSNALIVERKSLVKEAGKYYAYISSENRARRVPVSLGNRQGLNVEILSGLNSGDRLITEGKSLLSDGIRIRTVSSNR